jgi:hypothetical protein
MGADSKNHSFPAADLEPGGYPPGIEADTKNQKVSRRIQFPAGLQSGQVVDACHAKEQGLTTPTRHE